MDVFFFLTFKGNEKKVRKKVRGLREIKVGFPLFYVNFVLFFHSLPPFLSVDILIPQKMKMFFYFFHFLAFHLAKIKGRVDIEMKNIKCRASIGPSPNHHPRSPFPF